MRLTGGAEDALYASDDALCSRSRGSPPRSSRRPRLDPALAPLAEQLSAARTQLEDAARELGRMRARVSRSRAALAELEERLARARAAQAQVRR